MSQHECDQTTLIDGMKQGSTKVLPTCPDCYAQLVDGKMVPARPDQRMYLSRKPVGGTTTDDLRRAVDKQFGIPSLASAAERANQAKRRPRRR